MSDVAVVSEAIASAPEAVIDTAPEPVAPAPEPQPDTPPSMDDTLAAAWDKLQVNGVERGEDGKFTNGKDKPSEPVEAVQPPPAPPEPPKPAVEPPQSWTAERKAEWANLSPSLQEYILQREGEAHKAITSQGERVKSYEPLDRVITQYKADIERRGLTPDKAVDALFGAQAMLDRNPVDGLINIARSYGIDLSPAFQGQQVQAHDQNVQALQHHIARLEQRLSQREQAEEQYQTQATQAQLKEFAKDNPYFEDVRTVMASLMRDGHAETLQAAYDMAVNASPKIRERILADQRKAAEEQRKAEEAKREEEAKKKAAEAQKAARLNVRSGSAAPNPQTMDDTIQSLARKLYG